MRRTLWLALFVPLLFTGCDDTTSPPAAGTDVIPAEAPPVPDAALAEIDSAGLRAHVAVLADDSFEGRGTGTPGEQKTIEYIREQMQAAGLEGGAADGSFYQPVPLLGSTPTEIGALTFTPENGAPVALDFVEDFIASTDLDADAASFDAPLVFVGYGISNPGYDWDDFKDVDVSGKVLVSLVNDPPATAEEPDLFQADTLTYNGRWTYKYEEARRRGAAGILLIHTEPTAGYPFTVLSSGARGEQIQLTTPPDNPLQLKGWITEPVAQQLAAMSGTTLDAWMEAAATRDFQPQELPVTADLAMEFERRRFEGTNVIGKLAGTARPEEAIVYTAHHDHLGIDRELEAAGEDGIYNGAVDNASGVAMMLELAEAFVAAGPSARTVVFITLTAEESGLLGSGYYAENPAIPLANTIANINVDSGNLDGATEDIVGIGAERSEMLGLLRTAAAAEGMSVTPDNQPNQGIFFRSDQLAFARGGVPAVFVKTGRSFRGQPADYADQLAADYRATRYHQPADELSDTMPFAGIVQQTRVALRLGYAIANSTVRPQWNASEAFAETRAQSEAALRDE
ncbi:MAG: M20/M25/M40 family metallo-hydrolase [Rhodothermales bacterium]